MRREPLFPLGFNKNLDEKIESTYRILKKASTSKKWIITFSGGKDSSVLLDLSLRFIVNEEVPEKVLVIYSDTLLDWPLLRDWALSVLDSVKKYSNKSNLSVETYIVEPSPNESFLEMIFKRGYPAPSPHFRWCTERLKSRPTLKLIRNIINDRNDIVILTGIRAKESKERSGRLRFRTSNNIEGPFFTSNKIKSYAPLSSWTLENIWDYIENLEPIWTEPSWNRLRKIYGPKRRELNLRFGCILCPLIRRDLSGLRMVELGVITPEEYDAIRRWVNLYIEISRDNPELWREKRKRTTARYKIPYGKLNEKAVRVLREEFCNMLYSYPRLRKIFERQMNRLKDLC